MFLYSGTDDIEPFYKLVKDVPYLIAIILALCLAPLTVICSLIRNVFKEKTKEEKELFATLPFTAETGFCWQYYVTAVFENGSEGHASKMVEVQL